MISLGFDLIKLAYLLYVFENRPEQSVDTDQTPKNTASDQGQH